MYIYIDDALQLNPHPPCSSVHYCSAVHYCTSVHLDCRILTAGCRLPVAGLREGFFCFVRMGYIQSAVVQPAVIHPVVIHPVVALHLVEWVCVGKHLNLFLIYT